MAKNFKLPEFAKPMIPTNLPGVFAIGPEDDLEESEGNPVKIFQHYGQLFYLSKSTDNDFTGSKKEVFKAKDRVVPRLHSVPGKYHVNRGLRTINQIYASNTWGGAVLQKKVDYVNGLWGVPPVSPGNTTGPWDSSSWIGIDGFGPSTGQDVLQCGIEQAVDINGNASYTPWLEWYVPAASGLPDYVNQTNIDFPVNPSDRINATVYYGTDENGRYALGNISIKNRTTGQHFYFGMLPPGSAMFLGACAEWIMETPLKNGSATVLPNFSILLFQAAFAQLNNQRLTTNVSQADSVILKPGARNLTRTILSHDTVEILGPLYTSNLF